MSQIMCVMFLRSGGFVFWVFFSLAMGSLDQSRTTTRTLAKPIYRAFSQPSLPTIFTTNNSTPMVLNPLSWFSSPAPATSVPSITGTPLPIEAPVPVKISGAPSDAPAAVAAPPLNDAQRFRRQLTMLLAGSTFLALSVRATRKVSLRKQKAMYPTYFRPNNQPPPGPPGNAALEAVEALNLASLNVLSFAMMLIGGGMVAMDVTNIEELRNKVRDMAGEDTQTGEERRKEEEEWEEWMVGILARQELKDKAKKMAEEEFAKERARK